jgi:hypothetical protein
MSSAAKQIAVSSEEDKDVATTLYLCLPMDIWSVNTREYIIAQFPKLKIVEIDAQKNIVEQINPEGFGLVLCETRSKEQIERGLKAVRALFEKIKQKDVTVSFITQHGNEAVEQLEKSNVVQILTPNTSSKALKIKFELFFSKMKAAKKALKPVEDKDYLFKAATEKKHGDKVIQLKPDAQGKGFEVNQETKTREWGKGGNSEAKEPTAAADYVEKRETPLSKELESPAAPESLKADYVQTAEEQALLNKQYPSVSDISGLGLPGMKRIVLISPRNDDITFAADISRRTGASFHYFHEANENLQNFLARFPETIVFWDIDHIDASNSQSNHSAENIGLTLTRLVPPIQVFAISNENINRLPYIFNYQKHVFAHCLFRGGNPSAIGVYSKIVSKMMSQDPFDIQGYFGEDAKSQQITIKQNSHRGAAVSATEKFLTKCGLIPRLAVQAAQAADELILNAVHSAPVDSSGNHYRKSLEQPSNFRFSNREQITLSVFQNEAFYAISVRDHFGSLKGDEVLNHLQKNYARQSTENGAGLGLNSVLGSGFSLLIAVEPGKLTEVSIFFPNAKSFRSFRRTFRFLSVTSVESDDDGDEES